ncbi:probable arginine--tRNA ligase, mitochondrial [Uranotaenia lowii]|uniref:probable arginine--tRNA ligase, mitochondrial n=1 Tax=Uranotaenia lowii TaxID=190385 RepID=UPI00247B2741|nr:probable arginine--tRNA ligase, mitochondrial [Uranotaenia lowii]
MAQRFYKLITEKILEISDRKSLSNRLVPIVSNVSNTPQFHWPCDGVYSDKQINSIKTALRHEHAIEDVSSSRVGRRQALVFHLNRNSFIHETMSTLSLNRKKLHETPRTIIEFSSPNIAKPFHAGHLRSTVIGNFLSNLFNHLGHDVTKINYLGDWGTQLGYLMLGIELQKLTKHQIKINPIQCLYNAYVHAHEMASAQHDLDEKARQIFKNLEDNSQLHMENWNELRSYTVDELKNVYNRLGISFDHYFWESQYGIKDIDNVLSLMEKTNTLSLQDDGRRVTKVGTRVIPIVKSDGTTLYIARDIAALIDRFEKFQFNNALYVVDNAQSDHFAALSSIARNMNLPCATGIKHVKFGRVLGMSTRKGTAIFLQDILDEADALMKKKQIESKTTKIDVHVHSSVTSVLGATAVVVNDLKQRRMRDYNFSWEKALQTDGDTGIKLQYTHCRLWSLQCLNADLVQSGTTCNPQLLPEPEALAIVVEISKFDEILMESADSLESCVLVNYLFGLSNAINRAMTKLSIKNESCKEKAAQRMALFIAARKTLERGMEILGLRVLKEM